MHKTEIAGKEVEYASQIEELTPEEFRGFMNLVVLFLDKQIDADMFRRRLVMLLLDVKAGFHYLFLGDRGKWSVHQSLMYLAESLDSFFVSEKRDGMDVKVLNLDFIKQMLPRMGRYYGPSDALQDISLFEYKEARTYYVSHLKHPHHPLGKMELARLAAVLYRPHRKFLWLIRLMPWFDGREKVLFTSKIGQISFEKRAKDIYKTVDYATLYGLFQWFHNCDIFFSTGKIEIDGQEIDLSALYTKGEVASNMPDIGIMGLIFSLAESGVFGGIEETSNAGLYDVFARLYQLKKQAEDEKALLKKGKG